MGICYTELNMEVKFFDVFSKTDWFKISILLIVAIVCSVWVFIEYQEPIIPPEWADEFLAQEVEVS